ncbi:MAG: GatB/YqeY domain-containing protein [Flavobacteriales bacterium]|nr:GatB/YqeY domain-containing protein [Flavobacteriales bacterium]MBK9196003.1 GatB/YqeY domain-containing protein [Flavobacteriales bacterium]MBP6574747.1 GatB/YqeY domain-containing protein [Flavobacteriales bacterium]
MDLKSRIDADIKSAMLAKDKDKLNALRAIKSAILLELTKEGGGEGISEEAGMKILGKLHKQRAEAGAIFKQQGREDLAQEEEVQAKVIEAYLPARLSEGDVRAEVAKVIADLGASGMAAMGKVMGEANKRMAGKADGSQIASIVKQLLGTG